MMSSLFSAVSGMKNHQTRMDVLGNNIANVNTVGFKASRVTFQDQLSQTLQGASMPQGNRGGTNPMQKGLGVSIASIDTLFTDGSYQNTGKDTDLAIQGSGFFVLSDGNEKYYTRAGLFDFDTAGNYVVPGTGLKVNGWIADGDGKIDIAAPPGPIQIPVGKTIPAKVSEKIVHEKNLSADAKPGTSQPAALDIYDAEGMKHQARTMYSKIGDNLWIAHTTVEGILNPPEPTGTTQLVEFNTDGTYKNAQNLTKGAVNGVVTAQVPQNAREGTEIYGSAVVMLEGVPTVVSIKAKKTAMEKAGDPTAVPPVAPSKAKWQIDYTVNSKAAGSATINEGEALPDVQVAGKPPITIPLIGNLTTGPIGQVGSITPQIDAATNGSITGSLPINSDGAGRGVAGKEVRGSTVVMIDGKPQMLNIVATSTANENEWKIGYEYEGKPVVLQGGGTTATVTPPAAYPIPDPNTFTNSDGTPVTFVGGTVTQKSDATSLINGTSAQGEVGIKLPINSNGAGGGVAGTSVTTNTVVMQNGVPVSVKITATSTANENEWSIAYEDSGGTAIGLPTVVKAGDPLPKLALNNADGTQVTFKGGIVEQMPAKTTEGLLGGMPPNGSLDISIAQHDGVTLPLPTAVTGTMPVVIDGKLVNLKVQASPINGQANMWDLKYDLNGDGTYEGTIGTMSAATLGGPNTITLTRPSSITGLDPTIANIKISLTATVAGTANSVAPGGTATVPTGTIVPVVGSEDLTASLRPDTTTDNVGTYEPLSFTPQGGVAPMTVTIDRAGITQFGGDMSLNATDQDGYAAGSLKNVTIDQSGVINGIFSNGQSQALGQVAMANFNNPAGLEKAGSTLFVRSNNSGEPQVGAAGVGGLGTINGSRAEMSNVDLSEEFSNMIITQRGFQSNARVITTSDEMLQELTNLKR